jgi:hypothetical protein
MAGNKNCDNSAFQHGTATETSQVIAAHDALHQMLILEEGTFRNTPDYLILCK